MRTAAHAFLFAVIVGANLGLANGKETATDIPTALQDYVAAKDDAYAWNLVKNDSANGFLTYDVELTSQVWQGITWKHAMAIYIPMNQLQHRDTVLLFINGGDIGNKPGEKEREMGRKLAAAAQMPVAFLYQVPNQQLMGDRKEDDLISETLLKYLETKDATWPALFPMVKSAVRAMDAVQEIALQKHNQKIERFVAKLEDFSNGDGAMNIGDVITKSTQTAA